MDITPVVGQLILRKRYGSVRGKRTRAERAQAIGIYVAEVLACYRGPPRASPEPACAIDGAERQVSPSSWYHCPPPRTLSSPGSPSCTRGSVTPAHRCTSKMRRLDSFQSARPRVPLSFVLLFLRDRSVKLQPHAASASALRSRRP